MSYVLFTQEDFLKRVETLKNIPSSNPDWYPSKEDIDDLIKGDAAKNIDFLIWLSTLEQDFTMSELETKEYVQKLLKKTIRFYTKEEIKQIKEMRMKPKKHEQKETEAAP